MIYDTAQIQAARGFAVGLLLIAAGTYYSLRMPRDAQSPKLYVRKGQHGQDRLLVDPEKLPGNDKSHFSIHAYRPSPDGHFIAYQLSAGGSQHGRHAGLRLVANRRSGFPPKAMMDMT